MPGRFGQYIKAGKLNVTLPKGTDAAALTLEEAVRLVDAKAATDGGGSSAKRPVRKAAAAPAKKATAKSAGTEVATKTPAVKKRAAKVAATKASGRKAASKASA